MADPQRDEESDVIVAYEFDDGFSGPDGKISRRLARALRQLNYRVSTWELQQKLRLMPSEVYLLSGLSRWAKGLPPFGFTKKLQDQHQKIVLSRAYVLIASEQTLNKAQVALRLAVNNHKPVILLYRPDHEMQIQSHAVFTEIAGRAVAVSTDFDDFKKIAAQIDAILRPSSRKSALQATREDGAVLEASSNKSASQPTSDVFISYAQEDAEQAKKLAEAIKTCGWQVWWDRELVPGVYFRDEIERQLGIAKCVVVLWSKHSIKSRFVVDEATQAIGREVLVQVLIEGVAPPLGFGQHQYADLTNWNGEPEGSGFPKLKKGISRLVPPQQRQEP